MSGVPNALSGTSASRLSSRSDRRFVTTLPAGKVAFSGSIFAAEKRQPHYDPTLPCLWFLLVAFTWALGGYSQIRKLTSKPSDSPAHCSSLLAPTLLPTYQHLFYFQTLPTYFWIFRQAGNQKLKRPRKGLTCTSPSPAAALQHLNSSCRVHDGCLIHSIEHDWRCRSLCCVHVARHHQTHNCHVRLGLESPHSCHSL